MIEKSIELPNRRVYARVMIPCRKKIWRRINLIFRNVITREKSSAIFWVRKDKSFRQNCDRSRHFAIFHMCIKKIHATVLQIWGKYSQVGIKLKKKYIQKNHIQDINKVQMLRLITISEWVHTSITNRLENNSISVSIFIESYYWHQKHLRYYLELIRPDIWSI